MPGSSTTVETKRVGIAAGHGGFELKQCRAGTLRKAGHQVVDWRDNLAPKWAGLRFGAMTVETKGGTASSCHGGRLDLLAKMNGDSTQATSATDRSKEKNYERQAIATRI